jgi:predicted dehydrogenase
MSNLTRRQFTTAAAAGLVAATAASAQTRPSSRATTQTKPTSRKIAPDAIRLGFIGVGNRGDSVLSAFLHHDDADVVAICDVYQPYIAHAVERLGTNPKVYADYRQLLDRKDIDAVVINTPDHWHALQFIHACQAGKDVYVEKPLSLKVAEGRAMSNAAAHYKRVSQVGTQRRSNPLVKEMCEFLRGGGIGEITFARAFHIQNEYPNGIGKPADSEPPKELDWDAWCGPAPLKPYNKNRSLYRFRWFYDYSGGQLTNQGVHYMDVIQWALGQDAPRSVTALGGKFADFDNREIPDTLEVVWQYDPGTLVTFTQINSSNPAATAKQCELEFRGTKGTLYYTGESYEVVPDNLPQREFPVQSPIDRAASRGWRNGKPVIAPKESKGPDANDTVPHARNFLDCVKSRKPCNAPIETGHRSTSATLIANIAHQTRSLLDWDAKAERFTNNDAANKLLSYDYRKPYELPVIG